MADSDGRIGGAQRNVRRTITPRDDVGELVKLPQTPLDLPVAQRLEVGQSGVDDVNKGAADRPAALGAAPVPAVKGTLSLQLARLGTTSTPLLDHLSKHPRVNSGILGDQRGVADVFPTHTQAERDAAWTELSTTLIPGGPGRPMMTVAARLAESPLDEQQRALVKNVFAEVVMSLDARTPPDAVNKAHTLEELSFGLDAAHASGLTPQETAHALCASAFSDAVKKAFPFNEFIVHNVNGAIAAAHVLPRFMPNPADVATAVRNVLEHHIGPPMIMMSFTALAIEEGARGQGLDVSFAAQMKDPLLVASNKHRLKEQLGLSSAFDDVMASMKRKIYEPLNPAHVTKNIKGFTEIKFTPDEKKLMALAGMEHWYTYDPTEPKTRQRLMSEVIVGADSMQYTSYGAYSEKYTFLIGPGSAQKVPMLQDLFASVKNSFNDVRGLAVKDFSGKPLPGGRPSLFPPAAQAIAEAYQGSTERGLAKAASDLTLMIRMDGGVRVPLATYLKINAERKLDESKLEIVRDDKSVFVKAPKDAAGKVPFLESPLAYPEEAKPERGPAAFEFAKLMLGMISTHVVGP